MRRVSARVSENADEKGRRVPSLTADDRARERLMTSAGNGEEKRGTVWKESIPEHGYMHAPRKRFNRIIRWF